MAKRFKPVYFFGYGSLLRAGGINGRGLFHNYSNSELIPVRLKGFRRGFNAGFMGMTFYGLLPDKKATVNGVLIPIHSQHDYMALVIDEGAHPGYGKNQVYQPYNVTEQIEEISEVIPHNFDVHTLVSASDNTGKGFIRPSYVARCQHYAELWGKEFYEEFLATGGMTITQINEKWGWRSGRGKN